VSAFRQGSCRNRVARLRGDVRSHGEVGVLFVIWMPSRRHPRSAVIKQVCQNARITAGDFYYLGAARCPGYQRDVAAADAERSSDRGQRRLGRLGVHSLSADPHDQRTGMFATNRRARRARPDPDSDPHTPSVPPAADTRRAQRRSG